MKFKAALAVGVAVATVVIGVSGTAGAADARPLASGNTVKPTEPGKTWSYASTLGGLGALGANSGSVSDLSCAAPGNCAVVGSYGVGGELPFTADEVDGVWQPAKAVPGVAGLAGTKGQAHLSAVSCWAPGDCAAAGSFQAAGGSSVSYGLVVLEKNGAWGKAQKVSALGGQLDAVSCSAGGYCAAVGTAAHDAHNAARLPLAVDESKGAWSAPLTFALPTAIARPGNLITSVSCPAAGDCVAVGEAYTEIGGTGSSANVSQGILLQQDKGKWASFAVEVPGLAALGAKLTAAKGVSCPSAGNCTIVGNASSAKSSGGFLAVEYQGTWLPAKAMPAQTSGYQLNSVSCIKVPVRDTCYSAGSSTATAFTELNENNDAFAPGPLLGLPALGNSSTGENPRPVISCSVSGYCATGGSYLGTTTGRQPYLDVKGGGGWQYAIGLHGLPVLSGNKSDAEIDAVSCTATGYCSAAGSYLSKANRFEPFVVNLATNTAASLSVANTSLTYGQEQARHVTVKLTAAKGTPTGKVVVTAGSTTVCTIKVTNGNGSCHLTAKQLKPGGYLFQATYTGSVNYIPVLSATIAVEVTE